MMTVHPINPLSTEPSRQVPLSEQAFHLLRQKILCGEFQPGEKLKIERLQRDYGLSSSPLREALNRLVMEGLVSSDDRRGFRAATVSIVDLREVTRLRLLLDCEALDMAMRSGDGNWEARIVGALHWLVRIEDSKGAQPLTTNAEWSLRHKDFHMALLEGVASPKLLALCSQLFDQAERYRRLSMQFRKEPRDKVAEHKTLMEAVLARDRDEALKLLQEHISKTAENVVNVLDRVHTFNEN